MINNFQRKFERFNVESSLNVNLQPDTGKFLEELSRYAGRELHYPMEVGLLIDIARKTEKLDLFHEIIFQAKFIQKTFSVMNRIGKEAEGYVELSAEFNTSVKKTKELVETLTTDLLNDQRNAINGFFFPNLEDFERLIRFCHDLGWVKNWVIDGKKLP